MVTEHASVDSREVAHYAGLAATWWDTAGPFWPLHRLNGLRAEFICRRLCAHFERDHRRNQPLSGLSLLDVGCGGGILSEAMARLGGDVYGIDVVERNIAIARHHAAQSGLAVRYDVVTAEQLASEGKRFDVVLNMEVVEHVADLNVFLHACTGLMRPSGTMIVATINRTWLSYLFAIVGAEYVLRWLPRGTHQWRRFPKPRELERLLERDGLMVAEKMGVKVNPFSKRLSLTRSTAVNYMLVARSKGTSAERT